MKEMVVDEMDEMVMEMVMGLERVVLGSYERGMGGKGSVRTY